MSCRTIVRLIFYCLIASVPAGLTSCEKFEGDQTIPAYISIDSIYLQTNYGEQGSSSHSITDVWVYVDEEFIGAFQMPARFPVLKAGEHKLKILPGIKRNGISATRTNYPFYKAVEKTIQLVEDSTLALGIQKTSYEPTTEFYILEDFEGLGMVLDTTPRSDVPVMLSLNTDTLTFEGNHSGLIELTEDGSFFECVNNKDYTIPYQPVFMELNFNTNNVFAVGVFLYGSSIAQVPVLYLNPTGGKWKKVYVDLTNALNSITGSQKFRIFFGATKETGVEKARIAIDNIKVISRDITQ